MERLTDSYTRPRRKHFQIRSWLFQMDESKGPSHYVRLTKEKEPLEEITPGELNQPVQVPQLVVHRCLECGQPLPESYEPPADEDWTTGVFGCFEDTESCVTGLFCPCLLFGQNVETLRDDITRNDACFCHALCVEGGMVIAAATLFFHGIDPQTSFLIGETLNSPCHPCLVHCCLHWCALCQEHRELKNHLSDNVDMQMTLLKPPPVQVMTSDGQKQEEPAPALPPSTVPDGNDEQPKLEITPV
ncbi:cell number regulator 6-like [Gossypium australe]|uniref:Cell number regulator 6-like n=1 Tax=Gossypium australe TaxID=47621 RepID=A0A5B6W242_9ROSI|nr:cell number regulator 6-like [Gossypium australe]